MPAARISFAGPGKSTHELSQAIAAEILIEMESENEAKRIARLAESQARKPRVAIRVNPNFQVRASAMRMGGGSAQFGVDTERVPAILKEFEDWDLEFVGFHVYCGSQILRPDILKSIQENTIEMILSLAEHTPFPITHLNIGGGYGIPYFPKDKPLDIAPVGEHLGELIENRVRPRLPEARVIVELGRYIVGEAGIYVCRIVDRKISRGRVFLITDGGLHHQLAASGNFGQVIRRNFPVAIGNRIGDEPEEKVSVVGCLCTPLDLLADGVELPRTEVGDLVVIFQSGAYGLTASPTAFLGHPPPPEVLV